MNGYQQGLDATTWAIGATLGAATILGPLAAALWLTTAAARRLQITHRIRAARAHRRRFP